MKIVARADYRIINTPSHVIYECTFCDNENIVSYVDVCEKTDDGYDVWRGNAGIEVACELCGKVFELANASVD